MGVLGGAGIERGAQTASPELAILAPPAASSS
jgi:hypothetical protein